MSAWIAHLSVFLWRSVWWWWWSEPCGAAGRWAAVPVQGEVAAAWSYWVKLAYVGRKAGGGQEGDKRHWEGGLRLLVNTWTWSVCVCVCVCGCVCVRWISIWHFWAHHTLFNCSVWFCFLAIVQPSYLSPWMQKKQNAWRAATQKPMVESN